MSKFLSNFINKIEPYVAGEQPCDKKYVKLNTNENAYPPSFKVMRAIKRSNRRLLRRYPDPNSSALKQAIAKYEKVDSSNIFLGNGSDEVLAFCFPTFFDKNQQKAVYFADITYSFYPVYCNFFEVNYKTVKLGADFLLNLNDYDNKDDCNGIIIANPNAPTGRAVLPSEIEKLLKTNADKIFIIDEAYVDFYGKSCAPLTAKYPNLVVVKTFSKGFSLAGIRCGYAVANAKLISGLERCKDSFNSYPIDRVCQNAAKAAIEDIKYYNKVNKKIIFERERLQIELASLGFKVIPSDANFIFAAHSFGGSYIYKSLKDRGVLVRYFARDKIKDYVRITVGTKKENNALIVALQQILASNG